MRPGRSEGRRKEKRRRAAGSGPPRPRVSSELSAGLFYGVEGPRLECLGQGQTHRKEACDLPKKTLTQAASIVLGRGGGGVLMTEQGVPAPDGALLNLPPQR